MLSHVLHMKTFSLAEEKQILKTIHKQLVETKIQQEDDMFENKHTDPHNYANDIPSN